MSLTMREPLKVGDTVCLLSGGPLMKVEGFAPWKRDGKTDEQGMVKCVVVYTDDRPDSEKERVVFPHLYLDKWRRKPRAAERAAVDL